MSSIGTQIHKEKRILYGALVILTALVLMYMYCVSASVLHVVMYKETTQSLRELNTVVAQLEAEYIAAKHNLSAQIATLPDFVDAPEKVFIERSDTALVIRDRLLP